MKIEGSGSESGSISQSPDPHQNVMDLQHCFKLIFLRFLRFYAFYVFRIIFKAFCTALTRQAAPPPSRAQSVSISTYCGMLGALCGQKEQKHKRLGQ
jgi:hypothetical protein